MSSILIYSISFLSNLILYSRITIHKIKLVPVSNRIETYKDYFLSLIETNTLGDITICFVGYIILSGHKVSTLIFNSLQPEKINNFPTYLLVYWFHHSAPSMGFIAFWSFIFYWKPSFRVFLLRSIKEYFLTLNYSVFKKLFKWFHM